jgi:hypothetical protein
MSSFLKQIETRFELFESESKPDYIDIDGDGDKEEPMEKAAEEREQLNDSVECDTCKGAGCDHCDGNGFHEKVDEMSTSAAVAPVTTPYAFSSGKKKKKKYATNSTGYSVVEEALERRYEKLIEGYRSYVTDNPKMTSEAKVKGTIREVSKRLKEIEEMVANASRLKTESGMSRDGYGRQVNSALTKISERLIKISERVRSLGE